MVEIRVAWPLGLHEDYDDKPIAGGLWLPDTPTNRAELMIVVEAGNEACGPGSHWLEEREA